MLGGGSRWRRRCVSLTGGPTPQSGHTTVQVTGHWDARLVAPAQNIDRLFLKTKTASLCVSALGCTQSGGLFSGGELDAGAQPPPEDVARLWSLRCERRLSIFQWTMEKKKKNMAKDPKIKARNLGSNGNAADAYGAHLLFSRELVYYLSI
eukprot:SAG11_NODE_8568_length_1000_cov_0.981132_2_plen_151_part_00